MLRAIGAIEKHTDIHRERERERQIFVTPAQASANQSRSLLPWLLTLQGAPLVCIVPECRNRYLMTSAIP